MTWVPPAPPATSDGSTSDGIVASSTGASAIRPYFDASNACSTSSIDVVPTWIRPRSSRASPPAAGNSGSPSRTRLTLATVPGVRMLPARQRIDGPTRHRVDEAVSSRFGSRPDDDRRRRDLLAALEHDARHARRRRSRIATTRAPVRISAPAARGRRGERLGERRRAAPGEHRLARGPAVVAGRSRRAAPRSCPPTTGPSPCSGRRARRASRAPPSRLERLRDEVGDRHREHAQDRASVVLAQPAERAAEPQAQERIAEARRPDLGRRLVAEVGEEAARAPARGGRTRRTTVASSADQPRIASTDAARSAPQRDRPTIGLGREDARPPGDTSDRPCFVSPSSRATDGRSRPTVWASDGTRTPGASSSVTVAPPIRSRASRTSTLRPPVAR